MPRYSELEVLSAEVRKGLRWRVLLRRVVVALGISFLIFFLGAVATSAPATTVFSYLMVGAFAVVFFGVITLLFEPCPRCAQRFSEPSIVNLFFFPCPTAFTSSCASCGLPLRKAG
jgi:cytochrome c biogenesis protein CcdA